MKTILTFSVCDPLHEGHLNLFQKAKALGGKLIVGIPTSWTIEHEVKGHPTMCSAEARLRVVQALDCVDFAFVYTDTKALEESIRLLKPSIVCRADDNENFVGRKVAEEAGAKIVFFPYTPNISSTQIRKGLECRE